MTMNPDEKQKHIEWLEHRDIRAFLSSSDIPAPWFSAFRFREEAEQRIRWFAALVPPSSIPHLSNGHPDGILAHQTVVLGYGRIIRREARPTDIIPSEMKMVLSRL